MDKYRNYVHLSSHENENSDYRVESRAGHSGIAIVAPHGGRIERGTTPIADALAGEEHAFYSFEGIKEKLTANQSLHLTSENFDEPRALSLVSRASRVITIHGARGKESAIYAGGLDRVLRYDVLERLSRFGITAADDPSPTRQGVGVGNICNRGISRQGLQLEFTFAIRKQMFGAPDAAGVRLPTELFYSVVKAIREVLVERSQSNSGDRSEGKPI